MTNEEAVKWIKCHRCLDLDCQDSEAMRMAIEALERQIPKKPKMVESQVVVKKPHTSYRLIDYYCCNCGKVISARNYRKAFCPNCGQTIDWSEEVT